MNKVRKNLQKSVDNRRMMWYYCKALERDGRNKLKDSEQRPKLGGQKKDLEN